LSNDQNTNDDKAERYQTLDYILGGLILVSSFIYGAISGEPQSKNDTQHPNQEIAHWTRVVGIWTRVLAGVAVITAGVLGMQTCVLYNQLTQMKVDQRAWLAPKNIDYPAGFAMQANGPYKPTTIGFNFTNTGKEPATLVNRVIGYKFLDNTPWDRAQVASKIDEILGNRSCKDLEANPNGDTVFPSDAQNLSFALNASEAQIVQGGGHWMMIAGCLIYRTIEATHWTEVCRFLDPIDPSVTSGPPGFRTAICPIHNQAN
jgi:hypothetical protein